mgnify:FL=1
MKIFNIFKGLSCALLFSLSNSALAEWANIDNDISIDKSRPHYDRINRLFAVQVTVTNNSTETLEGPFRLLIDTTNIPAALLDGETDSNTPYFDVDALSLAPNESMSVTAHFERQRLRLNFAASLQSNPPPDTDNDGVIDDLDLCPDTVADADVNAGGCALAQLDSDNDSVNNELDFCPDTAVDAEVDVNGCALAQLDSDNDGVNDELDFCPDTAENDVIDEHGCTLIPPTTDNGLPVINFELGGTGADFGWNVFENTDNPAVQLVANPDTSGTNSSTTVAMFTARADGAPWAGAETAHGDIGPITLDATNSSLKIMVYKTIISDVGLKLAIANGGAQPEIKVAAVAIKAIERTNPKINNK